MCSLPTVQCGRTSHRQSVGKGRTMTLPEVLKLKNRADYSRMYWKCVWAQGRFRSEKRVSAIRSSLTRVTRDLKEQCEASAKAPASTNLWGAFELTCDTSWDTGDTVTYVTSPAAARNITGALLNSGARPVEVEAHSSKHDAVMPSASLHHLSRESWASAAGQIKAGHHTSTGRQHVALRSFLTKSCWGTSMSLTPSRVCWANIWHMKIEAAISLSGALPKRDQSRSKATEMILEIWEQMRSLVPRRPSATETSKSAVHLPVYRAIRQDFNELVVHHCALSSRSPIRTSIRPIRDLSVCHLAECETLCSASFTSDIDSLATKNG